MVNRIIFLCLIVPFLLTSCATKNGEFQESDMVQEKIENEDLERDFHVMNNKKIKPMFSEKIDFSKMGMEMPVAQHLASQMTKGDDGACYFFRKSGDASCIVFKRNNNENVMTTEIPENLVKERYVISSFVKYKERFFVNLFSNKLGKEIFTSINISDGKWSNEIEHDGFDRIIVYDNKFFCCVGKEVTVIDLYGNQNTVELDDEEDDVIVQTIINDKIFYSKYPTDNNAVLMCCDLDGTKKEKLFTYDTIKGRAGYLDPSCIRFDDEYLYLFETMCGFTLMRIPMYGGEIEEIRETNWFDLSDNDIYFVDTQNNICKIDKSLSGSSKTITKACAEDVSIPFYYTENHLIIEKFNRKEYNMLEVIWESEVSDKILDDITMYYVGDYYLITEDGKIDDKIKGTGFKNEYYQLYKQVK